jgi:Tol biopolymer transport system component
MFEGDDVTETLAAVVLREPEWDGVPVEVRRLLKKCLAKDPKKRLRDIGDVWELLEEPNSGTKSPAQAESLPHPKWPWAVAAAMALALGALAFVHFREPPPPEHTLRYTIPLPEGSLIHSFAVSPDGQTVVLAALVSGKRQLWLRSLDALQFQPMPSTEDAAYPFWSPDSRYIGFFALGKLRKIAASGGPSQALCDASDARGGSWNRDDVIVFSPSFGDNVIRRVSAAGGTPSDVTKIKVASQYPSFLPDGRRFVYLVTAAGEMNGIYVSSLDGAENRRLLADNSDFAFAPPAPGSRIGYVLFLRETNLMAQPVDAGAAQLAGEVFPVAEGIPGTQNGSLPVSVSNNGVLVYWNGGGGFGGQTQIVFYDRGGKAENLGTPGAVLAPALSPNEKTIVFSRGIGETRDIWLWDLVRRNEQKLTKDAVTNFSPFFSPNGDRIVYRSNRGGHRGDLWVRAANGSGQDELLLSTPNQKQVNQWSRDGKFIVYSEQDPKTKWDLWYLPLDQAVHDAKERKGVPFLHSEVNELYGQLSPNSHWMAYTSDVSGKREVYVQPFPSADNEITISTAGGEQPRWSHDGKELFYLSADGKLTVVAVTETVGPTPSFHAGTPVALFDAHLATTNAAFNYDVSADGKRFLAVTNASAASQTASGPPPLTVRVNWNAAPQK